LVCGGSAVGQTSEELIGVHKAFMAALDGHKADVAASYFTDDGVWDWVPEPAPYVGKEQIGLAFSAQFTHSPDYHTDAGRVLAAGNIVVVEHTTLGTQTGPLADLPPTGKAWTYPHMCIYDFEGNKIKRLTSYCDNAGFYRQIGVMPAPAMPSLVPSIAVPAPEPTGLSPLEADAEHIRRWNSHDAAAMAKIYHADCQIFAGPLGARVDRVTMTAMNELYFSAFPDIKIEVVRRIDLGNRWVLTEFVTRGTHQGTFFGVPAQGYPTELRAAWLTHYTADGLLIEGDFYYDNLTLMTQITTPEWSPEGQWISASPTPAGNLMITGVWIAQDAGKTRFLGQYKQVNMLPLFNDLYPGVEAISFAGEQAIKIGKNKYQMSFMFYYTKTAGPGFTKIVGLGTVSGTFELAGPDTIRGQATGAYYLAAQDADQDGFPDEGQKPALCVPWVWICKRPPMMPGCALTPIPESPKK
jgi:steroid delta-isomerase-like uncharacterized protein